MVSAYLREPSLIPAKYDHGLKSMLRQELVLEQMEADIIASNLSDDVALYRTIMANCTDQQSRSEIVHTYGQTSAMVKMLRERNMKGARMLSPESRTQKMKNVYEALRDTGLVDNDSRTFTDEDFYEIMEQSKAIEAEREEEEVKAAAKEKSP